MKIGGHRRLTRSTHEICRPTYNRSQTKRLSAILNLQNFDTLINDHSGNQTMQRHIKFHWNRMIHSWDIVMKPFSKWLLSTILNFQILIFWSRDQYLNVILLLRIKFHVNWTINRWDIAKKWFSIWRPSAILNLQNFDTLWRERHQNQNLQWHTKFHWNRMIRGCIRLHFR